MSWEDEMNRPLEELGDEPKRQTANAPRRSGSRPHVSQRASVASRDKGVVGFAQMLDDNVRRFSNMVSLNGADHAEAFVNSIVNGTKYDDELVKSQAHTEAANSRSGWDVRVPFTDKTINASPVDVAGAVAVPYGAGVRTVKGLMALGAGEAFVAGTLGSKERKWADKAKDGARMIPYGALGGAVGGLAVRYAPKAVQLVRRKKPVDAPQVAPAAKAQTPAEAPTVRPKDTDVTPTPKAPEPEKGALVSPEELAASPLDAVKVAKERLARMTDDEVSKWLDDVEKAELTGALPDDPHYRAILNVKLDGNDPAAMVRAVNAFEDIHEEALDRVAQRTVATKTVDKDVVKDGAVTPTRLMEIYERATQSVRDARVVTLLQARAGVRAAKLREEYAAASKAGSPDAFTVLKQGLREALQEYGVASAVRSMQGRALQIGQEANGLMSGIKEDEWELIIPELDTKLDAAFDKLGPEALDDLLAKLRSGRDIENVFETLIRPERVAAYSNFQRTTGTFEAFLKSNALTPTTAVFNGISALIHDTFRNGLGRRWAAARLSMSGRQMEALGLKLEHEVARSVYWQAHMLGLRNMLDRIKFDFWDSVEGIAGAGWGSGKVRAKASASRNALAAQGNFDTLIRENASVNPANRLRVNDYDGFQKRMDLLSEQGSFGWIFAQAQRAGAVTLNTLDALGTASGKLFTGATDEWARGFVAFKEKYALAARSAMKEALELDLAPDDIAPFVTRRAKEKAELPDEEMWAKAEEALLRADELDDETAEWLSIKTASELEADRVAVLDGPQTHVGKVSAAALGLDNIGLIFPYIRTPLRLMERGLVDYTPWGRFAKEGRSIIARGGPEAEVFKAQMEIGTTAMGLGAALGASGLFVVTNGAWDSSARIDGQPDLRLQVGDLHVEMGRLDPLITTLALGALWGQASKDGFTDYAQYESFRQAADAAMASTFYGFRESVLSKSYLRGLKDLVDVLSSEDGVPDKLARIVTNGTVRLIPAAGTQRQANETLRGTQTEAIGFADEMYRHVIGMGLGLPVKRNLLGDPVDGRFIGIAAGVRNDDDDLVLKTMKELGIDLSDVRRVQRQIR